MLDWLKRKRDERTLERRAIPDPLWELTLARFPFLAARHADDVAQLRELTTLFLARKEFTGVGGLEVDDSMAVAIAAQACLPILKLGLAWYDGFVGIVVHEYEEELSGEAMQGGPVMLSWVDVDDAAQAAAEGYNVVIHEFTHVLDMRDGQADGVPPLPDRASRDEWTRVLDAEYDEFCKRIDAGEETLLDPYAAEAVEEFFAVASEAFFVAPADFRAEHPRLYALLRGFFKQDPAEHA